MNRRNGIKLLIDGDVLVYRAGFAAEKTEYAVAYEDVESGEEVRVWCENKKGATAVLNSLLESYKELDSGVRPADPVIIPKKNVEPVANALHNITVMIDTMMEKTTANECVVVLSGPTNFRNEIATLKPYKGNRDPDHKPIHGPAIKEFIKKKYVHVVSEDEEADDVLGIMQSNEGFGDTIIASIDKDLLMIPGLHYNFVKEETTLILPEYGDFLFWSQLLSGDSTDNIPGIPGMGPGKSKKAMEEFLHETSFDQDAAEEAARTFYVKAYGEENAEAAMIENGRLIWIRRDKEELWLPPSLQREALLTSSS